MYLTPLLVALILFCSVFARAQTVAETKPTEAEEKLRKDAIAFLRETLADVNAMRSLENRISFTADLAGLMWFHDEREARAMYTGAIAEFKDLLARYDTRMNEFGPPDEDEEKPEPMAFAFDPSERNRLVRKFTMVLSVRQQMALSIAEHDPDLAFSFYQDTISLVANPALRQEAESMRMMMDTQFLGQIAAKDAGKAAKFGKKLIEEGVDFQHLDLLKKIFAKDADKGAEFGQSILATAKSKDVSTYILAGLIEFGGETLEASRKPDGKRPVYKEHELRELAELLASELLEMDENLIRTAGEHIELVRKHLPGRAVQIKAKFKMTGSPANGNSNVSGNFDLSEFEETDVAGVPANSNSNTGDAASQRRAEREKAEKKLLEDVQGLAGKKLPKEERDKFVTAARKVIATTASRDKKVAGLSVLAEQVTRLGDKELGSEIMRDAEKLVNPAPKNMNDFTLSWVLASGYSAVDPDKAFRLLDATIARSNDTLAAFVKVGEFIDVNEDFITDGEVQVGGFGGQMVRGLTKDLNIADGTIRALVKADFDKTKNLTNRFERLEVRVLAKMMVLRAILGPQKSGAKD